MQSMRLWAAFCIVEMTAESPSGHYDVEYLLGRGAMGAVYAARDRRIGRRVALKTIQIPEGQFEDATAMKEYFLRLQREAEVCGSLHHPHIVALYDVGYENERISYLAMELVEGETLQQMLKRSRPLPLPLETGLKLTSDVLRGLVHAHERSIVHRDVKPANVLITQGGTAKIADFGIARPQKSAITAAGALVGTPNYMSPEQVTGQPITSRADVFAVGVMLYEILSGTKPFAGNDLTAILHNILRQDPPHLSDVNPEVPRSVGDFVARMMSKTIDGRPTSSEALTEIESLIRSTRTPSALRPAPAPSRVAKVLPARVAIAAVGAVLAALLIPVVVIRSRTNSKPTVTIPAEQIAEFDEKRRALEDADALLNAGRFEESLKRYEAYLQKYPHSSAAEDGRDRAKAAIAAAAKSKPSPAPKRAKRVAPKKDEDISPRELLDRIKRAIRH